MSRDRFLQKAANDIPFFVVFSPLIDARSWANFQANTTECGIQFTRLFYGNGFNHRTSSRIARSRPSRVSGNIRLPISCRTMPIEWV